jgi:hypothetical protein
MLTTEAAIQTEHADSYLARLCGHVDKMGMTGYRLGHRRPSHATGDVPPEVRRVECSGTEGTVSLNWGHWTMRASPGLLAIRAESSRRGEPAADPGSPHGAPAEVRQAGTPDRHMAAARSRRPRPGLKRRSRRLVVTTNTELNAIAAAAISALRNPSAAGGMAAAL